MSTLIINNRIGDKKLERFILQPQLKVKAMLGTYHGATVPTHTTMVNVLQSAGGVKELVIWRRIRFKILGADVNSLQNVTCYGCGEKGYFRNKCPKKMGHENEGARRRGYVMRTEDPQQNPDVVTGTFLLNDHYTSILFDSGAKKRFVSTVFTPFIDIAPAALDTSYEVELADGKVVSTNTVLL
ncbi:reverse transcriptase domain-containing protein [Tanacetum coccineum]|uniref:Reverse transcriptase domain-containing protein n=1 Tax=Tanacetum coccineum TaxID=301880 RepID=A0ABQ4XEC0_9ASTR